MARILYGCGHLAESRGEQPAGRPDARTRKAAARCPACQEAHEAAIARDAARARQEAREAGLPAIEGGSPRARDFAEIVRRRTLLAIEDVLAAAPLRRERCEAGLRWLWTRAVHASWWLGCRDRTAIQVLREAQRIAEMATGDGGATDGASHGAPRQWGMDGEW